MILEGIICTRNADGSPHVTPMGFRRDDQHVVVRPFVPSVTLDNLRAHPQAVMNLSDDVRVIAGCLTGRRQWPVSAARHVAGWCLDGSLACLELEVTAHEEHPERPGFRCRIVEESNLRPFRGFNRAQAAVLEAAILVSRLDFMDSRKLEVELNYLNIAVSKTAGLRERCAWLWLLDAITAHPRHLFDVDPLR